MISAAFSSGLLFDEIIVVHNTDTYSGGGYRDSGAYKTNSYSSYCAVYNGSYATKMALHEFGHSFGDLCDEYSYTSEGYTYTPCVNCRASCSDWSSFAEGCQKGCASKSDYYRPEDSIMISYNVPRFNNASLKAGYSPDGLNKRADFFIVSPVPAANFRSNVTSGMVPLTVLFTDTSTNNPNSWNWQFGDGDTSEVQHPVHTYSVAGLYSVNLTVSNSAGSSSKLLITSMPLAPASSSRCEFQCKCNMVRFLFQFSLQICQQVSDSVVWEFGIAYFQVQHPVHTFQSQAFILNLTFQLRSSSSIVASDYINTTGSGRSSDANFSANVTYGQIPLTVQFEHVNWQSDLWS